MEFEEFKNKYICKLFGYEYNDCEDKIVKTEFAYPQTDKYLKQFYRIITNTINLDEGSKLSSEIEFTLKDGLILQISEK